VVREAGVGLVAGQAVATVLVVEQQRRTDGHVAERGRPRHLQPTVPERQLQPIRRGAHGGQQVGGAAGQLDVAEAVDIQHRGRQAADGELEHR
jgi:hypothetical protein